MTDRALGELKRLAQADPRRFLGELPGWLERPALDYTSARTLQRALAAARAAAGDLGLEPLRVALLAGDNATQLAGLLTLFLAGAGLRAELYEPPFGVWRQEVLNPESGLYRFAPHIALIAPGSGALTLPPLGATADELATALERELAAWRALWDPLERAAVHVVQDDFVLPLHRPLGSLERSIPSAPAAFVARVNEALRAAAPGHVTIHDLDHLASCVGKRAWLDERFYFHSKQACALEALPEYARSLAAVIRAIRGKSRKCLVLDLDHTLWGGVVGDDGTDGLRLGPGSGEGEAFQAFQRYVLGLRARGVVLAVCSKNEDEVARRAFAEHPEMVLRPDDVAVFLANWQDKPHNLRRIAAQLELGLDALVFVDDNPAERAVVRAELPAVAVPELPADPAEYASTLDRGRYFEAVALTEDDRRRADYYRANALRDEARVASSTDLEGFLAGLGMVAQLRPLESVDLARATQLINKSNQFNLTLRRLTEAQVAHAAAAPDHVARTLRLRDRFGDNGLVSVVVGRVRDDALELEVWVMSCRVLARGVERALLAALWADARARGLARLEGLFVPGPRNALVVEHYPGLGFRPLPTRPGDPAGATRWALDVVSAEPNPAPHITVAAGGTTASLPR